MATGIVRFYNDSKGFGLITPDIAGQFQKGGMVSVTFPQQSQRVGLKVSLNGFSSAYKALLARHGSG